MGNQINLSLFETKEEQEVACQLTKKGVPTTTNTKPALANKTKIK